MKVQAFISEVNKLAENRKPFFFLVDFELQKPIVCPLKEAAERGFYYDIHGVGNSSLLCTKEGSSPLGAGENRHWLVNPISKAVYSKAFAKVKTHIERGDSYLLNLTFPSKITTSLSLEEVFVHAQAPYKLLFQNHFTLFSPECFVRIENDIIHSFPMKGTTRADRADAAKTLLADEKELWEHNTIVDLLRNDLSIVSDQVKLERFRYLEELKTQQGKILQSSSEIQGRLSPGWRSVLGEILWALLPAGSVSGAPKEKTVEIIAEAEQGRRGYYCGVFGIYDGEKLESGVNIRFLEYLPNGAMQYRSGGGITFKSNCDEEYQELIDKIYVPSF